MNEIRIDVDGETALEPGSEISGTVHWTLTAPPSSVHTRLFWYTEGKGDRDISVVDETSSDAVAATGTLSRLGAFVITAHREGLLPTALRCETSPDLLLELLDELAPDRPRSFPSAESLWHRHDGDLRQAMFEAYDIWGRIMEEVPHEPA